MLIVGPTWNARAGIVIELPTSFVEPVLVTVGDATEPVSFGGTRAIDDVIALLDGHLFESSTTQVSSRVAMPGGR